MTSDTTQMSSTELAGCRAFPAGATCPREWCAEAQHWAMCKGCVHFGSGRTVSRYQEEKNHADPR